MNLHLSSRGSLCAQVRMKPSNLELLALTQLKTFGNVQRGPQVMAGEKAMHNAAMAFVASRFTATQTVATRNAATGEQCVVHPRLTATLTDYVGRYDVNYTAGQSEGPA